MQRFVLHTSVSHTGGTERGAEKGTEGGREGEEGGERGERGEERGGRDGKRSVGATAAEDAEELGFRFRG
jgi:hypothetical protein